MERKSFRILREARRQWQEMKLESNDGWQDQPSFAFSRLSRLAIRSRERSERLAKDGGEEGIRTPGSLPTSAVFKTAALNHSATSPWMDPFDRRDGGPATILRQAHDFAEPGRGLSGFVRQDGRLAVWCYRQRTVRDDSHGGTAEPGQRRI